MSHAQPTQTFWVPWMRRRGLGRSGVKVGGVAQDHVNGGERGTRRYPQKSEQYPPRP